MNRNNIRFCKQRDKYSCGPIALLNIDKFYGESVVYIDLPYYQKLVDCRRKGGTRTNRMSDVLGRAKRKGWPKTKEFLSDGWSCLVIQTGDGIAGRPGHYSIVIRDRDGTYVLVNHRLGKGYASEHINGQELYWLWRKAYRIWYVDKKIERWKDVVGYEGYYQVSDLGRVRSMDRFVKHYQGSVRNWKGKILQLSLVDNGGHLGIKLSKKGIKKTICIHQLVAAAWIGPCPEGQQVRHGPNGIADNSVSNLCYGTRREDCLDKRRDGTHGGKPVRRSDGVEFINMRVAAEESGCWYQSIWSVCNGRLNKTGGYSWEYI